MDDSRHDSPTALVCKGEVLMAVLLFGVTLILFWPARGFGFIHLDDPKYILENPILAGGLDWSGVRKAFSSVHEQWWLPLLWISYLADIELFGPGPQGHHLANILLHAANAALLFWVLFRMTGSRWRSFFVAALFAWHPTRVEAVAWITARKDVLSGLFFMLALWAYARHAERPSAWRIGLVFPLMLAGLLSKAILIVLPPILLLLDFWPLQRAQRMGGAGAWKEWAPLVREKAWLIALAAVFMVINLRTHASGTGVDSPLSLAYRLGSPAPNVLEYLRLLALPIRLNVIYPETAAVSWRASIAAAGLLLGATVAAFRQRSRRPWLLTGWLWFLVGLLPILRGVRLGLAQYADRFTYLPVIGLALALAWTAVNWGAWAGRRRAVQILGVLVLALCLGLTRAQLPYWKDSLTLLMRTVRLAPTAAAGRLGLGNSLFEAGRIREAEIQYREAVRLYPSEMPSLLNWGASLALLGRAEEAQRILAPVMDDPRAPPALAHGAYGMASLHLAKWEEAIRHLNQALASEAPPPGYRVELIRAYFEAGEDEKALAQVALLKKWPGGEIRSVADLFPFYLQRWREGARPYAWEYFRRAVAARPESVALLNNAAWLAGTDPEAAAAAVAEAVGWARRAVELTEGNDAAVLSTLAVALAAAGDFAGAGESGRRALALAQAQGDSALAERTQMRLDLFTNREPYRE